MYGSDTRNARRLVKTYGKRTQRVVSTVNSWDKVEQLEQERRTLPAVTTVSSTTSSSVSNDERKDTNRVLAPLSTSNKHNTTITSVETKDLPVTESVDALLTKKVPKHDIRPVVLVPILKKQNMKCISNDHDKHNSRLLASKQQSDEETLSNHSYSRNTKQSKVASSNVHHNKQLDTACVNSSVHSHTSSNNKHHVGSNSIEQLLQLCQQEKPTTFEALLDKQCLQRCRKIGEATFSEVYFMHTSISSNSSALHLAAVKIIPFALKSSTFTNGAHQTSASMVYQEISIARTLDRLTTDGHLDRVVSSSNRTHFTRVYRVGICKGVYPAELLHAWDSWSRKNSECENIRPDYYDTNQLYAVLVLDYGGKDMEHFRMTSWCQAESLLRQVVWSLAIAERSLRFEHRDLHWGNILIAPITTTTTTNDDAADTSIILSNVMPDMADVRFSHHGIRCIIIDYTLSRLEMGNELFYTEFDDEKVFEGEGDYQYEVYRRMRQHTNNQWADFCPVTNVEWVFYLIDKIMNGRILPAIASRGAEREAQRRLRAFHERLQKQLKNGLVSSNGAWWLTTTDPIFAECIHQSTSHQSDSSSEDSSDETANISRRLSKIVINGHSR
ncbi:hypothetical protein BDF22DRAFT_671460 [Syncephalis plumigaleata]|nr:hypothetical protein BDF22DRAFT_671460 [Syncephalis plumigaleata]